LDGPSTVIEIDDFSRFYDRYVLLERKITQALDIAGRKASATPVLPHEPTDEGLTEADEAAALHGLSVYAVERELPEGIKLPRAVLAEAVTALRSGKHLLISGPPGTGKSTLAEALGRAVMGNQFDVSTGTADWTTFDTIGGYVPSDDGLQFEPGLILRALRRGAWVVIDELNRADIDKAFGPLFTLLAGTGDDQPNRRVVLPYRSKGRNLEIRWAKTRSDDAGYIITPTWRLIGTLNIADKASLFQLSFAFLRRFAMVNVPVPDIDSYRALIKSFLSSTELPEQEANEILECSLSLALGPRQLGPAILKDMTSFLSHGLVDTASGDVAYDDPVTAFVTAVRLYAVPQYEGADADEVSQALNTVLTSWPDRTGGEMEELQRAFDAVALS
jgi:MoxR-like ATPase